MFRFSLFLLLIVALFFVESGFSKEPVERLSLQAYLERVDQFNRDIQSSRLKIAASESRKSQPKLIYQPYGIAGFNYSDEKSTGVLSFVPEGNTTQVQVYSFGLQKDWWSGTSTKITHNLQKFDIEGLTPEEKFWSNNLSINLEQSLWKNFLGRENRARVKATTSQLDAQALTEKLKVKRKLVEAEKTYWSYALAVATRKSLQASLQRTNAILKWNQKRLRLKVIDKGDVLQTEAQVFELKQSVEDAKARETEAKRALMALMNEDLAKEFESSELDSLSFERSQFEFAQDSDFLREDVQASRLLSEAARQEAISVKSSLDPDLKLVASYGGNSADTAFSSAQKETFDNSFRKYEIGVQLSVPLGIPRVNSVKDSKEFEAQAKQLDFKQTEYRSRQAYLDLLTKLKESLQKIDFAKRLARTEKEKLENENRRFKQGRSTSFQILSFEEDLARAEISLLRLYAEARALRAELRLYTRPYEEF